jgi:hypothetical protein
MQTKMADAESMSALGSQKRPFCDAGAMSALPPKADIRSALGFLQI